MATRSKQRPARSRVAAKPAASPLRTARPAPAAGGSVAPRFFRRQSEWRAWLAQHHAARTELWVGFWRVATGKPGITWPQSVDEALCFGWIDGLRRGLDPESYMIRFTPRKAGSPWSRVNLARYAELNAAGLVHANGRAVRARWDDAKAAGYSHETPRSVLDDEAIALLRRNARAWRFWEAQIPSYRKVAGHWVTSAKREETRTAHLASLIDCCARGVAIPPIAKWVKVKPPGK